MTPRVRFAPSPTGYLHVGGARTALFNWFYARRHGGVFILRIEDTDVERSSADMVTGILEGLRWLGLTWDEGPEVGGPHAPYAQSGRLDRYRAAAERLLASGHAYRDEGAIRFRPRAGLVAFDDAVHGRIEFDTGDIEPFVILRSDGHPTYHLSVVVDDAQMAITDVVRGDDHISNTPKHVLLFEALDAPIPRFAHVPLILGADKKRLSKRHGATSVTEYQRQGYLPEAMVNFLALLGWSPGDDRELMSREELIASFSLEGISGGNAVFNTEKLDWMNGQYIARMPIAELADHVRALLDAAGLADSRLARDTVAFHRLLELLRPRAKRLTDFVEQSAPLLSDTVEYEPMAVEKHLAAPDLLANIRALVTALTHVTPFDEPHVEAAVRGTAEQRRIKAATLIHATRVGLTGRTTSPGLFELIVLLGRDGTIDRLDRLASFLAARS
ncbi:MAG TPA: glutamate--tRNA ligase [Vicinamibacterales bacterium]|nr:glutamate--tRNA ligase [Vicinamibacterales bacterium]